MDEERDAAKFATDFRRRPKQQMESFLKPLICNHGSHADYDFAVNHNESDCFERKKRKEKSTQLM